MKPLNIGIYLADQNPHRDRSLGITRMTECLAEEMHRSGDVQYTQIVSRSSFRLNGLAKNTVSLPWSTDTKFGRLVGDHLHPAWMGEEGAPDIYFYPKGYLPRLLPAKRPNVLVVHDTILQWYADYYPSHRSRMDYFYWCGLMRHSIRNADHILAVSETTERQVRELCKRFQIAAPSITVTPEGTDFESEQPLPDSEKQDYILHLASSAPHKRSNSLLQMWRELSLTGASLPPLKLVGSLDAAGQALLDSCPNAQKLPRLADDEFRLTMKRARAILIPSEIEGFGLPALEAYFCGTPVCFVEKTSLEEILSGATQKGGFDLSCLTSFQRAIHEVLSMPREEVMAVRKQLIDAFSMQKFGKNVLAVLTQVASSGAKI